MTGGLPTDARSAKVGMGRIWSVAIVAALTVGVSAVTRIPSADGQFWDIQDTSTWAQDSGGIATGGHANPFNGFGYLKLQVKRPDGAALATIR